MKYILVTGGVISGVGKGVITSSFGTILKHCGIRVTSIKIDPYINIDAGTFSPYEHGKILQRIHLKRIKQIFFNKNPKRNKKVIKKFLFYPKINSSDELSQL